MAVLAELLGESPGIVALRQKLGQLLQRQTDARRLPPILLQGETGTGKGLLARAIHRAGPRREGPFVDVNCAAIPETLLESEMFGFERGAFTDARQAKAGLLQSAHRGTIFLDEVGLLSEAFQAKLLKALEEQTVRRLGSTRTEAVDVWLLTATSEDLAVAARERRFREDLYHRLAVLTVQLPPLRKRGQDILLLAEQFLARACSDYQLAPKSLDAGARAALMAYRWPGNVRELANVMERVALLSEGPVVTAEILGLPQVSRAAPPEGERRAEGLLLDDLVGSVERGHLLEALQQNNWNISRAAVLLGISRNTLRYRIDKYGLRPGVSVAPARRPVESAPPAEPAVRKVAPPEPIAPSSIRWEQRRLTLLRADLLSSREERSTLDSSRHLEVFVDKAQSFGGRVEELSPTGMVAVFGLEPVEDAPRLAALAAMAIQKAVGSKRREGAPGYTVNLGIHTGQFMVGRIGTSTEIDLEAKRAADVVLETLAKQGEADAIVVSEAAATFLERRFDLAVAGEAASMKVYRLAGQEHAALGPGGRITRFVGRREELDVLRHRLASAVGGRGQVVGIVGEPGIGKSRLLFEFHQGLAGEPVTYLEGRCLSYGSAVPYFPVLEMLRRNCRLADTDIPETIRDKVSRSLERLGMDPDEGAPFLLHLLGIKEGAEPLDLLSPEAIKARTLETLSEMSLKGSRRRPLVCVFEDLHWIDKTSEEFIAWMAERIAGAPILFLCTYRPGYRPPWMGKSYATQMALEPLSPQDSLRVVHSVLETETVPERVAKAILDKAEGNPFFLEELARSLGEEADSAGQAVPDTIEEVLLVRIDRLPAEEKQLLQVAAVMGRTVPSTLLQAVAQLPDDTLRQGLRHLQALEFLYQTGFASEAEHTFKHALTQEVAYQSLLPSRREALHAAAGCALESLYADRLEEVYDRLAYHYSRTPDARKAIDYLIRVARKAAREFAHPEAIAALREALVHVERLPAEDRDRHFFDVVFRLANSLHFLGRFPEILELLLPPRERLERLGDASLAGRYYFLLGRAHGLLGDAGEAARNAQRAVDEARQGGDEATMGKANWLLSFTEHWFGRPLEAIERGREALALLERTEERWWVGMAHWVLGTSYSIMGEFGQALEEEKEAMAIGEAIGEPRLQSSAAWMIGSIHTRMGDVEEGIEACRRGLECSADPLNTAAALGFLGYAYMLRGDLAQAIPLLERSVDQFGRFRIRHYQGLFMAVLGEAALSNGETQRARELAVEGLEIAREAKFLYGVAWAQRALGRIAEASGAGSEAAARLREALETFASIQARSELARTHLVLAELAGANGESEVVAHHLAGAQRLFRALRMPKYLERVEQMAQAYGVSLPADPA